MKKRLLHMFFAALLAASLLAGCAPDREEDRSDPGEKESVDVVLNEVAHSIFYAPMYVAIEEGYFAEEGFGELILGQNKTNMMIQCLVRPDHTGRFSSILNGKSTITVLESGANVIYLHKHGKLRILEFNAPIGNLQGYMPPRITQIRV